MWKTFSTILSPLVLCAAFSGCFVGTSGHDPTPAQATGTLTASWTLAGSSKVADCAYYQVDRVNVVVVDDAGFVLVDEEPYCEDSPLSVDLDVGSYSTEVTLLDLYGHSVSDTVVVTDVRVLRDTEVFVDVDFPDGAID